MKDNARKTELSYEEIKGLSDEALFELSLDKSEYFEILLNRYKTPFLRKVRPIMSQLNGVLNIEDVIQETFVKIYLKGRTFKSRGNGSFKSWAYAVLMNTVYSAWRKVKREKSVSLDEKMDNFISIPEPIAEEEKILSLDYILSLISLLPETLKRTADLYFLKGKSHNEIAIEENTTEGAIRTRIHRARERIKKVSSYQQIENPALLPNRVETKNQTFDSQANLN